MQPYSSQDVGYMLITVGTLLALITIVFGVGYLIWLAIPVRAPKPPRPVPPPRRMPAQRHTYAPRHGHQAIAPTQITPARLRNLPPAQDPWNSTAFTEIR